MFVIEAVMVSMAFSLAVLSTIRMYFQVKNSPLLMMKLFFVMYVAISITISGYLVTSLFQSPDSGVNPMIVYYHRFTISFILLAQTTVIYLTKLPTFRLSYANVLQVTSIQGFFAFTTIWIILHLNHRIVGNHIMTTFDPLGLLFAAMSALVISYLITSRFLEIRKLLAGKTTKFVGMKEMILLNVFFFLLAVFLLLAEFLPSFDMPKFFWIIFLALMMAVFVEFFRKNKYLWFLTEASLLQVMVVDKDFGSIFFLWSPHSNSNSDSRYLPPSKRNQMVIQALETLHRSFHDVIRHEKGLLHLRYGDLSMEIAEGSRIAVIFVTTTTNNIVRELSTYFVKELEKDASLLTLIEQGDSKKFRELILTRPFFQEACRFLIHP